MLCDGLGHGPLAASAAQAAVTAFRTAPAARPGDGARPPAPRAPGTPAARWSASPSSTPARPRCASPASATSPARSSTGDAPPGHGVAARHRRPAAPRRSASSTTRCPPARWSSCTPTALTDRWNLGRLPGPASPQSPLVIAATAAARRRPRRDDAAVLVARAPMTADRAAACAIIARRAGRVRGPPAGPRSWPPRSAWRARTRSGSPPRCREVGRRLLAALGPVDRRVRRVDEPDRRVAGGCALRAPVAGGADADDFVDGARADPAADGPLGDRARRGPDRRCRWPGGCRPARRA